MRVSRAVLSMLVVVALLASSVPARAGDRINAIVGDTSYVEAHGAPPDASVAEIDRIRTHLSFVEAMLRQRDVSSWPLARQRARAINLDRLQDYWLAGQFPEGAATTARRPRFMDDDGRICAVGYLVEQSVGLGVATALNERYEHDLIEDMDSPHLHQWAADSGFTLRELATIQPQYRRIDRPIFRTMKEARHDFANLARPANRCVHASLDAWQPHPREVTIRADFVKRDVKNVVIEGANPAATECIRAQVPKLTSGHNTLHAVTLKLPIITPLTEKGTLNPLYVPVVFRRARGAVEACAVKHKADGMKQVGILIEAAFTNAGRPQLTRAAPTGVKSADAMRTCLRAALEAQRSPRHGKPDDDAPAPRHQHYYGFDLSPPR